MSKAVSSPSQQETSKLRVALETFGCRSNYADTVDLQAALLERGALPCRFDSEADVYVINTCTVTDSADKSALRLIRQTRSRAPQAKIILTGCMAEVAPEEQPELELVDAVVGPGRQSLLLSNIISDVTEDSRADTRKERKKRRSISLNAPLSEEITGPGGAQGEIDNRARYHLRVQEGCENTCTFCIIPETRGSYSSRPKRDVLDDIERLGELGYEEVVLTGTHLGGYGEDIGGRFVELLEEIAKADFRPRIRLSSIDPNDLPSEIIDLISESNVFCPHLHICVQAFSDRILKRMNRKYRLDEVFQKMRYIKERIPNCCVGSDVITGFPGETREEVEQAVKTFLGLPFSYLHVFPYSERTGTAATNLDGVVEPAERRRRASRWRALSERKRREYYKKLIGRELEVIVERITDSSFFGTSKEFVSVKSPDLAHPDRDKREVLKIGSRVRVRGQSYDHEEGKLVCVF